VPHMSRWCLGLAALSLTFFMCLTSFWFYNFTEISKNIVTNGFGSLTDNFTTIDFCKPYINETSSFWKLYNFSQVSNKWPRNEIGELDLSPQCEPLTRTEIPCDSDCQQFRQLLAAWPADKPKAVIYYLAQMSKLNVLLRSLEALKANFNGKFRYPVIIFSSTYNDEPTRTLIRDAVNGSVFFQTVEFKIPSHIRKEHVVENYLGMSLDYRHACRFASKDVFEQPILDGLEYIWRLDHDSFITESIDYDIFEYMSKNNFAYGYRSIVLDAPMVIQALWEAVCKLVESNRIKTKYFSQWEERKVFNCHFEVQDLSFWRSCAYRRYIQYLDDLGGIYFSRWGDSPIKSIALSLFVPENRIHKFSDVGYSHKAFHSEADRNTDTAHAFSLKLNSHKIDHNYRV